MAKTSEKTEAKAEKKAAKPAAPKKEKKSKGKVAANVLHYNVIKSPVITEKSTMASEHGKYIFKVATCACKTSVKEAVESIFNVEVTKVNVINYDGKVKNFKQRSGRRDAFKKAIVTLKSGQSIDLASGFKG